MGNNSLADCRTRQNVKWALDIRQQSATNSTPLVFITRHNYAAAVEQIVEIIFRLRVPPDRYA